MHGAISSPCDDFRVPSHCSDTENVSPDTLDGIQHLTTLRHIALNYPLRSALPPLGELPCGMSRLTRLTTLKLKRTPLQDPHPEWLGALTQLKHLLWDPYLPVDVAGTVPAALAQLTGLDS